MRWSRGSSAERQPTDGRLATTRACVSRQAEQPDRALEIAGRAATIAVETKSARMRRELGALSAAMRPWQDAPVGRELAEVLAPVMEGDPWV